MGASPDFCHDGAKALPQVVVYRKGGIEGKKNPAKGRVLLLGKSDYIMPPMPPISGIAGAGASSLGDSAIITSVVIMRPATEPAA